ncbi:hypothetical protein [Kosmotoga sp. DU53]|nr:hypothetical protein [Kosmotoga sp. DU53]OAA19973.1 hypothetical protein DU53_09130 [Kosmotoga sp. DU53]
MTRFFLVLLLLMSSLVYAEGASNTLEIGTYTFYYLSPDSSPNNFLKALIVGQTTDRKLKILYEGRELKLTLPGITFPEEESESIWSMRKLLTDRLLLGEEVYLTFSETMRDETGNLTPLLWVKFENDLFLLQSLLLSNGLVEFDETTCPKDYRDFLKAAELFAKNNGLGIWTSEDGSIKKIKVLGFSDIGTMTVKASLGDLVIVEIRELYEMGRGIIVIESRANEVELSGVRLAILSDVDGSEEDSFIFEEKRVLDSGEKIVIAVALDRSMVEVKNYDYVWETTIDNERGKLKIAYPDGNYDIFEYKYDRKLDGYEVTPIME